MYDRQLQQPNGNVLMPPPSFATANPRAIMSAPRSASPATSRGSGDNDASLSSHNPQSPEANADGSTNKGRALSTSKRAEQNRRAQRAFRERRDARVKTLEARAQLLDETIQRCEEANRRWEECRVLVDQLRHENAMLRSALDNAGVNSDDIPTTLPHTNGHSTDLYGDLPDESMNGDIHPSIVLEEGGAVSPSKKRKRREEGDVDAMARPLA